MTDIWKRFSLQAMGFPFSMFALLGTSLKEFRMKWVQIQSLRESCDQCLDLEFSDALCRFVTTPQSESLNEWTQLHETVLTILEDVAVCCPLNTESVENQHAISQALFARFRGHYQQLESIIEDSYIDSVVRSHNALKKQVAQEELPINLSPAMSRLGKRSRGSYSKPDGLFVRGDVLPKHVRLCNARARRIRRVSGWSIFCREHSQQKQLTPALYATLVKNLGRQWQGMNASEKATYQVRAEHENMLKQQLLTSLLPTKTGKHKSSLQTEAEANKAFRKFLIRAKPKRAQMNQTEYTASQHWSSHGLGLADSYSALKLDLFDTTSAQSHPAQQLEAYIHSPLGPLPDFVKPSRNIHDVSCGVIHGQCTRCIRHPQTATWQQRLVEHLLRADIKVGSCISVTLFDKAANTRSADTFVLVGVVYKKPPILVVVRLRETANPMIKSLLGSHEVPSMMLGNFFFDDMISAWGKSPCHIQVARHLRLSCMASGDK